jgi:hypothetical protein
MNANDTKKEARMNTINVATFAIEQYADRLANALNMAYSDSRAGVEANSDGLYFMVYINRPGADVMLSINSFVRGFKAALY